MNVNCSTAINPAIPDLVPGRWWARLLKRINPEKRKLATEVILQLLREGDGPVYAPANSGKTTALLMYAHELEEKGLPVILITAHPIPALVAYRKLFPIPPEDVPPMCFTDDYRSVAEEHAVFLVDESDTLSRLEPRDARFLQKQGVPEVRDHGYSTPVVYNNKNFLRF